MLDSQNLHGGLCRNIPSVNSLQASYMCLERPVVWGGLRSIQQKLGDHEFPLIDQAYYPSQYSLIVGPEYPFVAKVAHAHSGFGKVKIPDAVAFSDFKSHLALHRDYCTQKTYTFFC